MRLVVISGPHGIGKSAFLDVLYDKIPVSTSANTSTCSSSGSNKSSHSNDALLGLLSFRYKAVTRVSGNDSLAPFSTWRKQLWHLMSSQTFTSALDRYVRKRSGSALQTVKEGDEGNDVAEEDNADADTTPRPPDIGVCKNRSSRRLLGSTHTQKRDTLAVCVQNMEAIHEYLDAASQQFMPVAMDYFFYGQTTYAALSSLSSSLASTPTAQSVQSPSLSSLPLPSSTVPRDCNAEESIINFYVEILKKASEILEGPLLFVM